MKQNWAKRSENSLHIPLRFYREYKQCKTNKYE